MSWADAFVLLVACLFAFGVLGLLIVPAWQERRERRRVYVLETPFFSGSRSTTVTWHVPAGCDGNCASCRISTCPHGSR